MTALTWYNDANMRVLLQAQWFIAPQNKIRIGRNDDARP